MDPSILQRLKSVQDNLETTYNNTRQPDVLVHTMMVSVEILGDVIDALEDSSGE